MKTIFQALTIATYLLAAAAVPAAYSQSVPIQPACTVNPDTGKVYCY